MLVYPPHGSLAKLLLGSVVAAPAPSPSRSARGQRQRPLALIQGSLSARKVERSAPWLASLHRVADGSLLGLGLAVVGLSALTLHWQSQWTRSYQNLESSQLLEHRLQESTAVLEQHHLGVAHKPGRLVPTSSEKLIYVPAPSAQPPASIITLLAGVSPRQILAGY